MNLSDFSFSIPTHVPLFITIGIGVLALHLGAAAVLWFLGDPPDLEPPKSSRGVFQALQRVEEDPAGAFRAADAHVQRLLKRAKAVASGTGPERIPDNADIVPGKNALLGRYGSASEFEKRMHDMYHLSVERGVLEWERGGEVPRFSTRQQWLDWLLQSSPFNLVDGAWLSGAVSRPGPLSTVDVTLLKIWKDEVGDGVLAQNHATLWNRVLESLGLVRDEWLGDGKHSAINSGGLLRSEAFVADPVLLDSAFDNAALQVAVGLKPKTYYAEIIGMNLFLEFFASPVNVRLSREVASFGIPPEFFVLHGSIDNVSTGHGAQALEAVHAFLGAAKDAAEREALFARVWHGFLAFYLSYESFVPQLEARWRAADSAAQKKGAKATAPPQVVREPADAEELRLLDRLTASQARARMIAMMRHKAPAAKSLHGHARVGGRRLNEWFAEAPEQLVDILADSAHVVRGDAAASPLTTTLIEFGGPMFAVFTPAEVALMKRWITLLDDSATAADTNTTRSELLSTSTSGQLRQALIDECGFAPPLMSESLQAVVEAFAKKAAAGSRAHQNSRRVTVCGVDVSLNELLRLDDGFLIAAAVKHADLGAPLRKALDGPMRNSLGGAKQKQAIVEWIENGMVLA